MNDQVLFSIIIPVYNARNTLGECLSSIVNSSYKHYEIIIVDDGSSDESMKIAAEYSCKILTHEKGKGAAAARNTGVREAKGDILVFIDSDIVIQEDSLEKFADMFAVDEKVSGISGVYSVYNRFNNLLSQYKHLVVYYRENICGDISEDSCKTAFVAFRRDIFDRHSFDESIENASIEDIEFSRMLISEGYSLKLDKTNEVEHIKKFNIRSFSRNQYSRSKDILKAYGQKSARGFYLQKERKNTYMKYYILRVPLAALLVLSAMALAVTGNLFFAFPLFIVLCAAIYLDSGFLRFCRQRKGLFFAAQCIAAYFFDGFISGLGVMAGLVESIRNRMSAKAEQAQ